MNRYKIEGGMPLEGSVQIHGSKNSALPVLVATILNRGESLIRNCPDLSDVKGITDILMLLGCRVERKGNDIHIDSSSAVYADIPHEYMKRTRGSALFAGALLSRFGKSVVRGCGGCSIGCRPIDYHLKAFCGLGAKVEECENGEVMISGPLRSGRIVLEFPSVGATENAMISASLIPSLTVICNAACEPEIQNLADYLRSVGVTIDGDGTGVIYMRGTSDPQFGEVTIKGDRIVSSTIASAVAVCGGEVIMKGVSYSDAASYLSVLRKMGMEIHAGDNAITVVRDGRCINLPYICTKPYPGFPTDCQPLISAVMSSAWGIGIVRESIFENRFGHCKGLLNMGADLEICGRSLVIRGVSQLNGADVEATDLRCGASLVIAALGAYGISHVDNIGYIERGYEDLCGTFAALGAKISAV